MARRLKLEVGDWVMYHHNKALGRVFDRYWNKPSDYAQWGIYQYKIAWINDNNLQQDEWGIRDLSSGSIRYIPNGNAMMVLYGKV